MLFHNLPPLEITPRDEQLEFVVAKKTLPKFARWKTVFHGPSSKWVASVTKRDE